LSCSWSIITDIWPATMLSENAPRNILSMLCDPYKFVCSVIEI
jgi:hypothetical protein